MKSNTYAIVGALGLALLTGCAEMQGGGSSPAMAAPKPGDRKSTRLNSSHLRLSRMPSSA